MGCYSRAGNDRQFWNWCVVVTIKYVVHCPGVAAGQRGCMLRHCIRELSMRQHATGLDAILSDFDSNQFNCMVMMMMMMMMVMMMMKFFFFAPI